MISIRPLIFSLLTISLALQAPIASAQQRAISVSAEMNSRIYVGDAAEFRIVVRNANTLTPPDLTALIPGWTITYQGTQDQSSSMTTIINGQVTQRSTLGTSAIYTVTPSNAGEFTVPSIPVTIGAIQYQTAPLRITVVEPQLATDFALSLQAERTTAYVGQPIPISLRWKLARNVNSPTISLPIAGTDHELKPGPAAQAALSGQVATNMTSMRVNGQQDVVAFDDSTVVLDKVIIPQSPGTITIGAARVDFLMVTGSRARPFDLPLMDRNVYERAYSTTQPITITVIDLPTSGRPANFSGLVGKYAVFSSADATSVSVGDPIALTVGVNGPYPLSLVPPLDLTTQLSGASDFRIRREPVLPQANQAQAIFRTSIRPRSADIKQIGPISLTYFDPDLKQYLTASSKPIPLTVQATSSVQLPEFEEDEPVSGPTISIPRPGNLPDIARSPVTIAPSGKHENRVLVALVLLAAPPAFFVLVASARLIGRFGGRNPVPARRRRAVRTLRRNLKRADAARSEAETVSMALCTFAAAWFDRPPGSVTASEAAALFQRAQTGASHTVADILRECDHLRFGRDPGTAEQLASLRPRAISAAQQLIRELRTPSRAPAEAQGAAA